jgi:uncharacterized PurR-regulated membrane protein YhhQ (DUF165 family)
MKQFFFVLKMIVMAFIFTIIANYLFGETLELINLPSSSWVNIIFSIVFLIISLVVLLLMNRDHEYESTIAGA